MLARSKAIEDAALIRNPLLTRHSKLPKDRVTLQQCMTRSQDSKRAFNRDPSFMGNAARRQTVATSHGSAVQKLSPARTRGTEEQRLYFCLEKDEMQALTDGKSQLLASEETH
jgi:hypothetical protein